MGNMGSAHSLVEDKIYRADTIMEKDGRTDGLTDGRTDGRVDYYMPPSGGIKIIYNFACMIISEHIFSCNYEKRTSGSRGGSPGAPPP